MDEISSHKMWSLDDAIVIKSILSNEEGKIFYLIFPLLPQFKRKPENKC